MSLSNVLLCLVLLQLKHLIVDWCWQPEYEHKNKGNFRHFGGYRHAGKNALGTFFVFLYFFPFSPIVLLVLPLDFTIHFMIDWWKVNINNHFNLSPTQHPQFWWLTGLDQFLHQITYIYLMHLVISHIS